MEYLRLKNEIAVNYKKRVMQRAWQDYKVKKAHKGYENWTFADSLYCAHRHISELKRNGL